MGGVVCIPEPAEPTQFLNSTGTCKKYFGVEKQPKIPSETKSFRQILQQKQILSQNTIRRSKTFFGAQYLRSCILIFRYKELCCLPSGQNVESDMEI